MELRDQREPGWFWSDNELIDKYGEQIGAYGVAVYAALARFTGSNGACHPSITTIAKRLHMSRPTVVKTLWKLQQCGLVMRTHRRSSDGDADSNVYMLLRIKEGGKSSLPPSQPDLPSSKPDLLEVGNDVDDGSKSDLPKVDSSKKTQSSKKTETGAPPTSNATYELAQALAIVCGMDLEANKGQLLKEAKQIGRATPAPTPELLKEQYGGESSWWWSHDWRGQRGEFPKPSTIRETWGQWTLTPPKQSQHTGKNGASAQGNPMLRAAQRALARGAENGNV